MQRPVGYGHPHGGAHHVRGVRCRPGRGSQLEFETRRYASVAANVRGSVAALYGAITNLPDVLDVVVLKNTGNESIVSWGVTIPGHSA